MSEDGENRLSPETDFLVWVNQQPKGNRLKRSGAVIKAGPQVTKTVTLTKYGDAKTKEVRKCELRFRTHEPSQSAKVNFEESNPKTAWWCENDEIEKLLAYLHSDVAKTGRYQVIDTDSPDVTLLDLLRNRNIDAQTLIDGLLQHSGITQIVDLLTSSDLGLSAAESAVVSKRRKLVARLHRLIVRPESTETQIQQMIGDAYWLFGGRYVGVADRRNLMPLDEHDIPLLGADGTLHIVELKGPCIPGLISRYRNHWIVGTKVHQAVSQAMNYLRQFDELGLGMSKSYEYELNQKYDMRRVFATVVIGHSKHVEQVDQPSLIAQTLRSYNAHLSRVEVITYDQLVDSAERALFFEETRQTQNSAVVAVSRDGEGDNGSRPSSHQDEYFAPYSDDEPPF